MSWPPCATPRSMSADSPDTPTSPRPNATTAGHPTPPSTPSSPHDQLDHRSSAPFHDLAMPLGLDPAGIRWMRDLLRGYADRGGTVLLSSHLLHEIEVIADDIVMIGLGRIVSWSRR